MGGERRRETLWVWWFGRAETWALEAFRLVARTAVVRLASGAGGMETAEPVDIAVWEESYPGQVTRRQIETLIHAHRLAAQVVLQGPLGAAWYDGSDRESLPVARVPWFLWPQWWQQLLDRWERCPQAALAPWVPVLGQGELWPQGNAARGRSSQPRSRRHVPCRLLIDDAELARALAEQLSMWGFPSCWTPPPRGQWVRWAKRQRLAWQTVFWVLGQRWPGEPQRELDVLVRLHPRELVVLGVQAAPGLNWTEGRWPFAVVGLPLPLFPGALERWACQSAETTFSHNG